MMGLGGEGSGGPVRLANLSPTASQAGSERRAGTAVSGLSVAIIGARQGVSQADAGSSPPLGLQPWQSPMSPGPHKTTSTATAVALTATTPHPATPAARTPR